MNKKIIFTIIVFCYHFSFAQSQNKKVNELLSKYQKSYNENNYNQFADIIADTFSINGNWHIFSILEAFRLIDYPYLHDESKEIKEIKVNSLEKISDTKVKVNITRTFSNYTDTNLVYFEAEIDNSDNYIFTSFNENFTPTTKTTKLQNASWGIDPESFNKRKIRHIDITTKSDNLIGHVYDTGKFGKYVDTINSILNYIKQYSIDKAGFKTSIDCYSILEEPGYTTIYIHDKDSYIGSINDLTGEFEKDLEIIRNELFCYTTHENVETNLQYDFSLSAINNRWYADGFSEYIGYCISRDNDSLAFKKHFTNEKYIKGEGMSRKYEYNKHKGADNLLDWAIDRRYQDENPLIGEKYTYDDDSGQYGRALQFFIDFVEDYGEDKIREIHKHFLGSEYVSRTELLEYIGEITGDDIKARISKY